MLPALYDRVYEYQDCDLTFFVQVYRNADQLIRMLARLRRYYPGARVIVCSDGDDDPRFPRIVQETGAEYYLDQWLYGLEHGGRLCHRMLDYFFRKPSPYLFKIDPDTGFHRRFAYLPAHPGMFGTLQCNPCLCSIQGGFCGISLAAAEKMFQSQAFLSPLLLDPESTWATHPPLWRYMRKQGKVSTDWLCGYVATALGISQFGFSEVLSRWKVHVPNPHLKYAVTHPWAPGR
jgi:hypothetical protein